MNDPESKSIPSSASPFAVQASKTPASQDESVPRSSVRRLQPVPVLACWLLLACLPVQSQEPSKKQEKLLTHESGFLPEDAYSKLQPDPGNSDWLIYFKDPDVLKRSDTFVLEPVKVFFVPEVQQRDINPADQAKLEDYFTKAIRDELQAGHYILVSEPGPGVKLLRFAITNVEPNGNKTNAVITGTTAVATHAIAPGVGEVVPRLKVGRVSIEGEMVDSASGEVDMAFMTSKSGRRFFSGLKAFQKWGDIDAAFRSWAKNFRQRLDKAHAS
ncbi:MAG TPA: DUF3313 domain-containing protein [Edaphobacter sp.]